MSTRSVLKGERCTATAKGTGQRCQRLVIGGGVCRMHGQNGRVKAKRLERIALAEQLAATPRRSPGDVLLEAMHLADVLSQRALAQVEAGTATPKLMRAVVDANVRAAALARTVLSAEAEAVRSNTANDTQAQHLRAALEYFMREVGLSRDKTAEAALELAVAAVASRDWMPLQAAHKARKQRVTDEMADYMLSLVKGFMAALGINAHEPWPSSLIVSCLRSPDLDEWLSTVGKPPRSWWAQLAARAAEELGHADPSQAPRIEILPPLPRPELTGGL